MLSSKIKSKNTLVSANCQLIRVFDKNNAPLFNEFNLIIVNLDESEATKFYDMDEIDKNPNLTTYYLI